MVPRPFFSAPVSGRQPSQAVFTAFLSRLFIPTAIILFVFAQYLSSAYAQFGKPAQSILLGAEPVSSSEVRLTWRINNPDEVGGVRIYRAEPETPQYFEYITNLMPQAVSYIDKGLRPGTKYHYRVQTSGRKPIQLSAPSNAAPVTTFPEGAPSADPVSGKEYTRDDKNNPAIQSLTAKALSQTEVELIWTVPTLLHVASLRIYRTTTLEPMNFNMVGAAGINLGRYIDKNLEPGTTYLYQVKYNINSHSATLSPPSNTALATTLRDNVEYTPDPSPTPIGSSNSPIPLDADEDELLRQLNIYRSSNGLGPVRPSIALTRASDSLSKDLASRGTAAKTDSQGRNTETRARAFGYRPATTFETISAIGNLGPQGVLDLFRTSTSDNDVLLNPAWKVVGVARTFSTGTQRWHWVLDFAGFWDKTIPLPGEDEDGRIDGNEYIRTRPPASAIAAGHRFTNYGDDDQPYQPLHCDTATKDCWKDPPTFQKNTSLKEASLRDNLIGLWHLQYDISPTGTVHYNDGNGYDLTPFTITLLINADGSWVSQGYRAYQRPTPSEAGTWRSVHDAARDEEIVTFYRETDKPTATIRIHAARGMLTFFAADGGQELQNFLRGLPADENVKDDRQLVFTPGMGFFLGPHEAFPATRRCTTCP